tara:strand:+ start:215 stop:3547 length:3333 start_codon:yes stop_codon:yes gene_type:complete
MSFKDNWLLKSLTVLASAVLIFAGTATYAQEAIESEDVEADSSDSEQVDRSVDEVVVTGSRIKRSTFNSISPLQVITAEISRDAGLLNAADILQTSTSAGGQQVDLTFNGFVLDNGPGSQTISLRGLGANRTLVLINGRRLAPGGAEGAPYAPNIGLIPAGLATRYEILTDGASSVYGSDAIAGVTNVILKKDFDGLSIEGSSTKPKYDGGDSNNLVLTWGKVWDRGFIGMGLDHSKSNHATYGSRPSMSECEMNYEVTTDGEFRSEDVYYNSVYGMNKSDCVLGSMTGYVSILGGNVSNVFYTPGFSNGGWGNYSSWNTPYVSRTAVDTDGDGVSDVSFDDYNTNGSPYKQNSYLYPDTKTSSFMAYGEYTFGGEANVTGYFETLYSEQDYSQVGRPPQLFPQVPANNPFNLCNPNQPNGIDCGLASDVLLTQNQGYLDAFGANYEALCASYGIPLFACTPATFGVLDGPIGPVGTQPVVAIKSDRSFVEARYENLRFVAGLTGDMPFMDVGTLSNWTFDSYISYSKSQGESNRYGIRGDRLDLSLGNYSSTNTPCENDSGEVLAADAESGCVAVNMFAPSLYDDVVGDFATSAEREYLLDSRDFDTEYEQTVVSGSMSGSVYEMDNGPVSLVLGFEYRKDEINSMPDNVARDGLLFGYFSDGGAIASKDVKEFYFEMEAPLLANKPFAKELTVNMSARLTDDEIYGTNTTESFKFGWRPVNSLLVRGTYGTSFRAPNLRELYLANQTGFNTIFDPCVTPSDALVLDITTGEETYDGSLDGREPEVLENCLANGVDPTSFINNGISSYSVELASRGSLMVDGTYLELKPETSESWTAGFSWEQEFTNAFDFGVSSTYYEVDIENTIIEPSGNYIVGDCYSSLTGASPFCSRITRDAGSNPTLSFITKGFLNRDNELGRGVDVNVTFGDQFTIMDRPIDLTVDLTAHRQIERSTLYLDDDGQEDYQDYAEEWGFPSWRGEAYIALQWEKWRLQWRTFYLAAVDQDVEAIDPFSDHLDTAGTGFFADTCYGVVNDDVNCRDVGFAEDYMLHTVSLRYSEDNWYASLGVRNLADKEPPRVDGNEISSVNNAAIGYGYDLMGRTVYANFGYNF